MWEFENANLIKNVKESIEKFRRLRNFKWRSKARWNSITMFWDNWKITISSMMREIFILLFFEFKILMLNSLTLSKFFIKSEKTILSCFRNQKLIDCDWFSIAKLLNEIRLKMIIFFDVEIISNNFKLKLLKN